MKILAIDSTAVTASCAVTDDKKLIAQSFVNVGLTHSQTLLPLIDDTLRNAKMTIDKIDRLVVCAGPGSFTGVRIGVSTIKGIAFTNDIPCVGVSTLDAIAETAGCFNGIICAVMDARCNQVYNALFRAENGSIERLCEDRALSIDELTNELKSLNDKILLAGDGAELCYNKMNDTLPVFLASDNIRFQSGYGAAIASMREYYADKCVKSNDLTPIYLRLPQAERELNQRLAQQK